MSAKPATQTAVPALATSQLAPDVQGRTVLAAADLAQGGHPPAARAGDQLMAAQPMLLRLKKYHIRYLPLSSVCVP